MSREMITLKTRVRYDNRATNLDRRASTDMERLPNPIHYIIGQALRGKFKPTVTSSRK